MTPIDARGEAGGGWERGIEKKEGEKTHAKKHKTPAQLGPQDSPFVEPLRKNG